MKKITFVSSTLLITALLLGACQQQNQENEPQGSDQATANTIAPGEKIYGTVKQTFDSGGYTYFQIDTGKQKIWAAGPPTPLKKGDMIAFTTDMPMENFHSKTLNRDFPMLYFVSHISTDSAATAAHTEPASPLPHANLKKPQPASTVKKVAKAENGYTISEIYQQKDTLAGKQVRVRGEVIKVTPDVMGSNWIHIQDGSGPNDLTITTNENIKLGSIIVMEGKLIRNMDAGFGYVYDVLLEDGKIRTE